jgi:hypothetical protein
MGEYDDTPINLEEFDESFDDEFEEELKELEAKLSTPAQVVVGDGRTRSTDVVEFVDHEEKKFNAKYGLDQNGDPMPVDMVLEIWETAGYDTTLEEGFDIFEQDDDGSGLAMNFEQSGFNQW